MPGYMADAVWARRRNTGEGAAYRGLAHRGRLGGSEGRDHRKVLVINDRKKGHKSAPSEASRGWRRRLGDWLPRDRDPEGLPFLVPAGLYAAFLCPGL